METEQKVFEVYATLKDANQRLQDRTKLPHVAHHNEELWETSFDKHGCFHAKAESEEGQGDRFDVRRMEVFPVGVSDTMRQLDLDLERDHEEMRAKFQDELADHATLDGDYVGPR